MNFIVNKLLIANIFDNSPILNQNKNLYILNFKYFKSFSIFLINNYFYNFSIKFSTFKNLLSPIIKDESYYIQTNLYRSAIFFSFIIPNLNEFYDCSFINIPHNTNHLISYSNSGGTFKLYRCSFYNISTPYFVTLYTSVLSIEPVNVVEYKYNCFEKCSSHFQSIKSGHLTYNILSLTCNHTNIINCYGSHALLLLGKNLFNFIYSNVSKQTMGSGQWYHNGVNSESISYFHNVYNCSSYSAFGSNGISPASPMKLKYVNIIKNYFSIAVFHHSQQCNMFLSNINIIYKSKLIEGTYTLIAENVYLDISFQNSSIISSFQIINNLTPIFINLINLNYCYNKNYFTNILTCNFKNTIFLNYFYFIFYLN